MQRRSTSTGELAAGDVDNVECDSAAAKYILTLRYNPQLKGAIPRVTADDFSPKHDHTSDVIEGILCDSITENIPSQDRISLALSGGVDSTLILGLLRKMLPDARIRTISVRFADSADETLRAERTAAHLGVDHSVVFLENYLEELPRAISIVGQPFWDLHWYHVAKEAGSVSDILVSGDGGDELFAGYTFRYEKFLSLTGPQSTPAEKADAYMRCHERDWIPDQGEVFGKNMHFTWDAIYDTLLEYFANDLHPLEQVFLADYNGKMAHNFSPVSLAISGHFRIKQFSPFLAEKMVSYSMKIPHHQKYDASSGLGKLPLRGILERMGLGSFVGKKKMGFSLDTINYWKSFGYRLCRDYLAESGICADGWVSQDWIDKHLKAELDVRYVNKFLGLLAFEIWHRLFITKQIGSGTRLS